MEESLSEFMDNNGGFEPTMRPKVYEKSDGSRRWVWAPTRLVRQDEEDIPQVEEPPGDENSGAAKEEAKLQPQQENEDDAEASTQHSDGGAVSDESDRSRSGEETPDRGNEEHQKETLGDGSRTYMPPYSTQNNERTDESDQYGTQACAELTRG